MKVALWLAVKCRRRINRPIRELVLEGICVLSVTKRRSHVGKIISRREPSVQLEGSRTGTSRFGSGVYNTTLTSNITTMADPEKQPEQPKANLQKMVIGMFLILFLIIIISSRVTLRFLGNFYVRRSLANYRAFFAIH